MAVEKKRALILDAATRRFVHFGLAKTTMADIAQDLSLSKALLYYYYPDKNALYAAVLERIIQQAFVETKETVGKIDECEKAMMTVLDQRIAFIMKYYNLLDYSYAAMQQIPEEMSPVIKKSHAGQKKVIKDVLEKGMNMGQLKKGDAEEIAEMMIFALEGMRLSVLKNHNELAFPSKVEFDKILKLQKMMAQLLLDGLKIKS